MSIAEKLVSVMGELDKIDPSLMEFGRTKYAYLSENAITPEVKRLFVEHGLAIVPTNISFQSDTVDGNVHAVVIVNYTLVDAETGETLAGAGIGEGMDKGDKAVPKACTAALKQFMRHLLLIPSPDRLDPDNTASESYRGKPAAAPAPAAYRPAPAPSAPPAGGYDNDPSKMFLKFGKHKGRSLAELVEVDPDELRRIAAGNTGYGAAARALLGE